MQAAREEGRKVLLTASPGPLAKVLKMLISGQQLSEREQQLMEKSNELLALQKETDSMRADFSLLRNQFLTERKKSEKQVLSLKEALKSQRSQLEKNLFVSTCRPGSLGGKRYLNVKLKHFLHCFKVEKIDYLSTQLLFWRISV